MKEYIKLQLQLMQMYTLETSEKDISKENKFFEHQNNVEMLATNIHNFLTKRVSEAIERGIAL